MEIPKHEARYYKYGVFYYHKENPRLWVPKIDSFGWTLNFANKWSYVFCVAIVIIIVGGIFLAIHAK